MYHEGLADIQAEQVMEIIECPVLEFEIRNSKFENPTQ